MPDLLRLILLQDYNTRVVLAGAGLFGLAAGVIGCFAVLRRRALVGDALAHAALPGIVAAFMVFRERHFAAFLLGALVFGLLGVLCIAAIQAWTRIKEDAALGIVLSAFFGLGLALSGIVQRQPGGNKAGLDTFIFGKAASMVQADVVLIAAVALATLAIVAVFFKEFRLLCFDRAFAASIGRPLGFLDFALLSLVCACVIAGLPAVGVVLTAALLIIPAAAARFWTDRLTRMVLLSGAFGAASGLSGVAMSAVLPAPNGSGGLPTGAMIVLAAGLIFLVSMLGAPTRGVLAASVRRAGFRRRLAIEHVLRAAYEFGERRGDPVTPWHAGDVMAPRVDRASSHGIRLALRRGLVAEVHPGARPGPWYTLTATGRTHAARLVRAHRLWEHYLIRHAGVAPDHVHRGADEIEHVLPPSLVRAIESELGAYLPAAPSSPHPTAFDSEDAR
ncbi:MAG: iron chelate uptake ABC transporter family permease subunit [Phycisphaerales bacterium]